MWAAIGKWVLTTVVLPLLQQAVAAWLKSREKAAKLKDKFKRNQAKTEAYEADSSDDNFGSLP